MNCTNHWVMWLTPARLAFSLALLLCAVAIYYQPRRVAAHLVQSNADGRVTHTVNGITETWRIDQPNVRQPMTPYPQIRFQPGDQVRVTGGGCVRTGPHGKPWKRYVDPIGPDSGPHFHGMVLIPGAFGKLPATIESAVRILIAKGGTVTVAAITEPRKQYLWLGYEDDNYSDNDYNSPDEGVQGQCKVGDHLTGNAFVVVTIVHGARPPQPNPKPFDLLLGAFDDNDILLNPKWATQDGGPNTNASFRLPAGVTPSASFPDPVGPPCDRRPYTLCTSQPTTSDNGILCGLTVADGHHNWAAATYTGRIFWNDHSCAVCDGDYNFRLVPTAGAGLTKVNGNVATGEKSMKLEFSDDETIDHFHTPWWNSFHKAVDDVDDAIVILKLTRAAATSGDPAARLLAQQRIPSLEADLAKKSGLLKSMVNGRDAIVTGLLGLDCAHNCASELHPVWAMAIRVKDDPADETWAIFVRRFGNEGFCSRDQHYLDDLLGDEFVFRLPWRANASAASLTADTFLRCRFGKAAGPRVVSAAGTGVLVSFFLPVPDSDEGEMINGELHLQWTGNVPKVGGFNRISLPGTLGSTTFNAEADEAEDENEPEGRFAQLMASMTVDQRKMFTARLPRKTVSFDEARLRFLAPPRQLTALPARGVRSRPKVRAAPDTKKQSGDQQRLEALRAVFGNNLPEFLRPKQVIRPLRRTP